MKEGEKRKEKWDKVIEVEREKERMNSGNLPSKTTNILQETNPKTEVMGWKKFVSQTPAWTSARRRKASY